MDGKRMQARIALVAGGVGILAVLLVAALAPAAVRALLVTISLVAFVWAAVAFVNPAWGPFAEQEGGYLGLGCRHRTLLRGRWRRFVPLVREWDPTGCGARRTASRRRRPFRAPVRRGSGGTRSVMRALRCRSVSTSASVVPAARGCRSSAAIANRETRA